jgi:NADP-dependent 3-hydroxy acid dehydrogenase YdfG
MPQLTWLITGCSSGFGEEMTKDVLKRGDKVIATATGSIERLKHLKDLGAATLELDVTDSQDKLDAKVEEALDIYGDVDVLVNNAGYIEAGLLEDVG